MVRLSSQAPMPLDFALRFVDGKGFLGLREAARFDLVGVERLELEIPNLRFPFDVSGGAERFQSRRCHVTGAELRVGEAQLAGWLDRRPALGRFGISGLTVRLDDGCIRLHGRARVGERETAITARLELHPAMDGEPQRVTASLTHLRAYGFLPAPAPLIGLGLLLGLGATPADETIARPGPAALQLFGQPAIALVGIDRIELNPLELLLWRALPAAGWRLPSYRQTALTGVHMARGEITLRYGGEPGVSEVRLAPAGWRAADQLLARGELQAALDAYARLPGAAPDDEPADAELAERRLAVLASMPARFDEAAALGARLLERFPERPFALLLLGAIEAERGQSAAAAGRYASAAELFEQADEPADAREAAFRAGEEYARAPGADAARATRWLEKVWQDQAERSGRVGALLAQRYTAEERWRELLHVEKRRLLDAQGAHAEAAAHLRLGKLWLERFDDPQRARDELERALRLDENGETWELYARALDSTGEPARALQALEKAAAQSDDLERSVEALLGAAELAERAGALDAALGHVQAALERVPAHAVALARAASLLGRAGRLDEAMATYERAVAVTPDEALRAALYCELGRMARDGLRDLNGARSYVERSLELKATPAALRLAAELAEADGRKEELEQLLQRLAATGDREAPLRHARVLFELGRYLEAAAAAESVSAGRPEALALLVQVRGALGQHELERDALERLVAAAADVEPRIRLAVRVADEGDLDRARRLLQEALPVAEQGEDTAARALHRTALEALCDVLLRQGDDGALEVALGKLAVARPADDPAGRARALSAQGASRARLLLTAEAAESFRAALALVPDDPHARAGLAECAYALKRWDEARQALEPLHQAGVPPRVERALRLGEICERQAQPVAAIGFYQAALEAGAAGSDGTRAWNALVQVHHARGDHDAESRALLAAADDERTNESDGQRAGRLVAAGDILRKSGRTPDAVEIYERALALDTHQLGALDALENIAETDGDVAMQAQVLGRKVAATARRPAQQKAILGRLATLHAERLGRPDAAREAWLRALEIDPEFRPALAFLAAEARTHGDDAEELTRLEQLVALPTDPTEPEARVEQLLRLGQLHATAGRTDKAESCVRRALESQPRERRALQLYDELLTHAGRVAEVVPVLALRAQVESDPEQIFDLLLRRASLLDAVGPRAEAVAAYEELTSLKPSHGTPWTRLAALLRLDQAWARLAAVLQRLADRDAAEGRRDEAEALYVEVAHLYHDRLHDRDRAQPALERALELNSQSRMALGGLLALARARGNALEEDRLLGRLADVEPEPRDRAEAVGERARARQVRGDAEGALALLRELDLAHAPDDVLHLRVELEESRGQLLEAGPALETLRERAHAQHDLAGEKYAVRRLARLAAERGPSPAAEELFRRAVELDPDDRDAASALAQVERARGDDRAYLESLERLLKTARRKFEGALREAELCVELAEVLRRLGELDRAQARVREALDATAENGAAWALFGLILRDRGTHTEAAAALQKAADLDKLDAAGYFALGDSYDLSGDPVRAAAAFVRAGDAAPPRRRAEVLEKAGQEQDAIALWRGIGGEEGTRRAAQIARGRAQRAFAAGRMAEARVAAVEALVGDPRDEDAFTWATNGLSPNALLALLDELAQRVVPEEAALLYRRASLRLVDTDARTALERAATLAPDAPTLVALAERHLTEKSGVEAARYFQMALQHDPGCAAAALGLARAGLPVDAARALRSAYDQVADARTRAQISAALGAILRDRLADQTGARDAYRMAVAESSLADGDLRKDVLRSLAGLERAGRDPRAAEEALETLRQEGGADDADLRHLAELYAERGAHEGAIELLQNLASPSELLLTSLEAAGRYAELLALLEREAPGRTAADARHLYQRGAAIAAGPLGDPQKAAELYEKAVPLGPSDADLWVRLGKLYAGPLAEPDRAARCFARAYAADSERSDVLLPLADFHHASGEWEPATDYYHTALQRNGVPPDDLARVHLRLAEHARHRADAIAEEEALLAAVTFGASERAWPRLAAIYRVRGDRGRLATALKHQAERATGPELAALLREAVPLVAADEAHALDEQLIKEDPSDDGARERILQRLRAAGDQPMLVARLERELPRAAPARQSAYALELGRLATRLGDEPRALEAYRNALKAGPTLEAARGLTETLAKHKRESEAAAALETALFDPRLAAGDRAEVARLAARAYLSPGGSAGGRALQFFDRARSSGIAVQMDPAAYRSLLRAELRFPELVATLDAAAADAWDADSRVALEIEAADVLDRELGQRDEAARRYAGLLDKHPMRRDLAERARQLYASAGEPIHALAALDKEMRLAPTEDLAQLKIVRGELLLQAGADAEAEAEFLHALITTPRVGRAHAALADVYKRRGDLAGALEHLIAAADAPDLEPSRAAHCAVDAADVLLKEGDVTTAERLYQLAAALDPAARDAVEGLARLAAARGEHERHADLLGRAVLLTSDRRERARLALARARLFQLELKRDLDAYRCFKEAVACDPTLKEAARGLREMAEARGEWALAAEQLYREIGSADSTDEKAHLHVELGRLLEEKLLDTDEALRNYEQAAEILTSPASGRAGRGAPWIDLVRLYTNAQRLREAAMALDRLADTLTGAGENTQRAEALVRAGELYERGGDPQSAQERLSRAAAIGGEAGRKADDSLLRLADEAGDPVELRRRIEERLAIEPEGPERLALLRRLLELAAHLGDQVEVDLRAQEVLTRAPDDPVAFVQRKHVLEARNDEAGLAALLRARAQAINEPGERAERRFEAGRIAERLGDASQAATDYEQALGADPNHVAALDALADLAYRQRQLARARALYAQLGSRPSTLAPDEVLRRRAEVAEDCGYAEEARDFYEATVTQNPSNLPAHEALARLAVGRGDEPSAFAELRAILDLLPLDAVDRITELRRQLGKLAVRLNEPDQARTYFELVLAQDPTRVDVLEQLAVLYIDEQDWEEAAHAYGRLSYLAQKPETRADLLFRKGEIFRLALDDLDRANDAYLKGADLHPTHAPTLRRLVSYYYREGDFNALAEVVRELESLPAGNNALDEAAVEAGLGIALGGDEARGTVVVAVAQPANSRVAESLADAKVRELRGLDPALRAATRALGGAEIGRQGLIGALRVLLQEKPAHLGARQALGRLYDTTGDLLRARTQYAVLTFVDPLGPAGTRLREMGPPNPLTVEPSQLVHPSARGQLRDALTAIGPLVLGLPPAPIDADPSPSWTERLRPVARACGVEDFEAAVVVDLLDPAWAEPTRPPRLLLARRALGDEAVARFACARAMHALHAGIPLVEGRAPEDVAALVRAAAALFLPDLAATLHKSGAFVHAWQAELESLQVRPEFLSETVRSHVEVQLANCVLDANALGSSMTYCAAERLTADRVAYAMTGDLRAALSALAPPEANTAELRAAALAQSPGLLELLAFAATVA